MTDSPASKRQLILDAFEDLLSESGERAATLDAVAAKAGVSKGGLLYHFGSKEALVDGILDRLAALVADDVAIIRSDAHPVERLIRTSMATGSALDRGLVAASRLAQSSNPKARAALQSANDAWYRIVLDAVGDPVLARAIMLISDGLCYGSAFFLGGAAHDLQPDGVEELVGLVSEIIAAHTKSTP